MSRLRSGRDQDERGQGLVEFAMIVPVFLLLLLGMLEFGFIFDSQMTLGYGTREGARSGAAFGSGNGPTGTMPCTDVDKNIIAAVQRVLEAQGSRLDLKPSTQVQIYKATSTGAISGSSYNTWVYAPAGGPVVDGRALDFKETSHGWDACTPLRKTNGTVTTPPDSIGVGISYDYQFVTPLGAVMGFFGPDGPANLPITDKTVMALNPTAP